MNEQVNVMSFNSIFATFWNGLVGIENVKYISCWKPRQSVHHMQTHIHTHTISLFLLSAESLSNSSEDFAKEG